MAESRNRTDLETPPDDLKGSFTSVWSAPPRSAFAVVSEPNARVSFGVYRWKCSNENGRRRRSEALTGVASGAGQLEVQGAGLAQQDARKAAAPVEAFTLNNVSQDLSTIHRAGSSSSSSASAGVMIRRGFVARCATGNL
jgi:hypothetical protein